MFWRNNSEVLSDGPRIDEVREAVHANRVAFPVPVPTFPAQFRPEIQWRLVELYFIRGWSSASIPADDGGGRDAAVFADPASARP